MITKHHAGCAMILLIQYGLILRPLDLATSQPGPQGVEGVNQLSSSVAQLRRSVSELERKCQEQASNLRGRFGTLRFVPADFEQPLNRLLQRIEDSCKQRGLRRRSVSPAPVLSHDVFESTAVTVHLTASAEEAVSRFLNDVVRATTPPPAMIDSLSLTRSPLGIDLVVTFSMMMELTPAAHQRHPPITNEWLSIETKDSIFSYDALLAPRPPPPPPPTDPTKPKTPGPSTTAAPPPPHRDTPPHTYQAVATPFTGRLRGIMDLGGQPVAIFDMGGRQILMAEGDDVDGWHLNSIQVTGVEIDSGANRRHLDFEIEDSYHSRKASAHGPPAPLKPPGPPKLGLRGAFTPVTPSLRLPTSFGSRPLVFKTRGVDAGSIVHRAGLRSGDLILSIDSAPLQVGHQILGMRNRLIEGHSADIMILRNGETLDLTLRP